MSLIPSESLNFPDSFRANVGWRLDEIDDIEGLVVPPQTGVASPELFPTPIDSPKASEGSHSPPPAPPTTASPSETPTAFAATAEPLSENPSVDADDQQLELIPKMTDEERSPRSPAGTMEMNALLNYFLAAGAAPAAAPAQPNGDIAIPAENVATVAAVIPTNVAVEPSQDVIPPNEVLTTAPIDNEPSSFPARFEQITPAATPNQPKPATESIVAALQSLSHTDAEAPIGSVEIQTPAQANHILELIAAAVQRGALVGETIPEAGIPIPEAPVTDAIPLSAAPPPELAPTPAATPEVAVKPAVAATPAVNIAPPPDAQPVSGFSIAREPVSPRTDKTPRAPDPVFSIPSAVVSEPPSVSEPAPPVQKTPAPVCVPVSRPVTPAVTVQAEPSSPEPSPAASSSSVPSPAPSTASIAGAPKVPAKIRITPRKIKPRPQAQAAEEQVSSTPVSHAEVSPEVKARPVSERRPESPVEPEVKPAPKSLEALQSLMPQPELSARKIAAARLQLAQSDLFRFDARERRNRWIGFGLSELAVLTALILLGRYGFTHHFPDPTIKILVFILIFAAAAVAIALPVAFFRNDPKRWGNVGR